jgi:hypothetical protein
MAGHGGLAVFKAAATFSLSQPSSYGSHAGLPVYSIPPLQTASMQPGAELQRRNLILGKEKRFLFFNTESSLLLQAHKFMTFS